MTGPGERGRDAPLPWRRALARRWPLGLVGGCLVVSGVLMLALFGLAGVGLPYADLALDEEAARAVATVREVAPVGGGARFRVHYEFRDRDGRRWEGVSYADADRFRAGRRYPVEYRRDDPHMSRLVGTKSSVTGIRSRLAIGLLVLPGIVLLGLWLRSAVKLRVRAAQEAQPV